MHFKWNKSYTVNNDELDRHHKTLLGLLNILFNIIENKADVNAYNTAIEDLIMYADYHFTLEEQLMKDGCYEHIRYHVNEHVYFTNEVLKLRKLNIKIDMRECHKLVVFLGRWLQRHFIDKDKKIVNLKPIGGIPNNAYPT